MFWFQLWREWKLSLAELLNVFPEADIIYSASGVLILDNIWEEEIIKNSNKIWWTIKIFELNLKTNLEEIYDDVISISKETEWKFKYSFNLFWEKNLKLENILKKTKYLLKNNNVSSRYFNKDNGKNLSSAQILGNSIMKKWFDFNIVDIWWVYYFGKTIWVQDIDAYSKRDFWKKTDMQVWMLPPKLCQIMINLSRTENWENRTEKNNLGSQFSTLNSLYDPFVWLWTILIEALNMWFSKVFGSDLNSCMVEAASKNLEDFSENNCIEYDYSIIKLNAKFIDEAPFFCEKVDLIVSEWYLWEVMTKKNISLERIDKQKESLKKLYESFFLNLTRTRFNWTIVICFPFWELKWKYIYFNDINRIFENNNIKVENIFWNKDLNLSSKTGSLLYKRENQLVWREIFKLTIKK